MSDGTPEEIVPTVAEYIMDNNEDNTVDSAVNNDVNNAVDDTEGKEQPEGNDVK